MKTSSMVEKIFTHTHAHTKIKKHISCKIFQSLHCFFNGGNFMINVWPIYQTCDKTKYMLAKMYDNFVLIFLLLNMITILLICSHNV